MPEQCIFFRGGRIDVDAGGADHPNARGVDASRNLILHD